MFSEIMMYLAQNPNIEDWQAIAVFPRRSIEPDKRYRHRSLLQSAQFRVVYLEDFLGLSSDQIGVQLMQLIVSKNKETEEYLQGLVQQLQHKTDSESQEIIELISTIMVYKFPQLSREEIEVMFSVSDLKQTKVYQEALDEGLEQGLEQGLGQGLEQGRFEAALALVLRQLNLRVGAISAETEIQIRDLSLAKIEQLGEALLDFRDRTDVDQWLQGARKSAEL